MPSMRAALAGTASRYEGPYSATTSTATVIISMVLTPLRGPSGAIMGATGVVEDVTADEPHHEHPRDERVERVNVEAELARAAHRQDRPDDDARCDEQAEGLQDRACGNVDVRNHLAALLAEITAMVSSSPA